MGFYENQLLLSVLVLLTTALFVAAWLPPAERYRRRLRTAALVCFGLALIAALIAITSWLRNPGFLNTGYAGY